VTAKIRAVVFDFDGVLADSEPLHLRAYQDVLEDLGITLDRNEYYDRFLGFDDVGAFAAIGEACGQSWTERQITALVERKAGVFDEMLASVDVLYPGAAECVERLATTFPLGIASGALRHEIVAILRRAGLERHFRFIVASGDTVASKPSPDPYRKAAELLGLPPGECVGIEDSRWGIESAKAAGLRCVGITTTYPASELIGADAVIATLDEFTSNMIEAL
jgi:beta-phosphoglucomutase